MESQYHLAAIRHLVLSRTELTNMKQTVGVGVEQGSYARASWALEHGTIEDVRATFNSLLIELAEVGRMSLTDMLSWVEEEAMRLHFDALERAEGLEGMTCVGTA